MKPLNHKLIPCVLALCLLVLAGCNFSPAPRDATPTVAVPSTDTPAPTPEPTISLTPSRTLPAVPQLVSPTPTVTPGPPTATYTPSETPGPYQHVMKSGETLGYIIQLYGYTDLSVIDQIVRLNPNVPDADHLPGEGATILIPRQTATPTPTGFELTVAAAGGIPPTEPPLAGNAQVMQHTVLEGQTIIGIAGEYSTTLEVLHHLNPDIRFFNCDFSNPSGGPDCNVSLSVGQTVNVPEPTPTPTLSPTPSGSETPTPTPTFVAPILVFPPEGAKAPGRSIVLQWVSIGELPPDMYYLIEVQDVTLNRAFDLMITRDTSINLPDTMVPTDGQLHDMRWRVRVGAQVESGAFNPNSAEGGWRTFQWQSR